MEEVRRAEEEKLNVCSSGGSSSEPNLQLRVHLVFETHVWSGGGGGQSHDRDAPSEEEEEQ